MGKKKKEVHIVTHAFEDVAEDVPKDEPVELTGKQKKRAEFFDMLRKQG